MGMVWVLEWRGWIGRVFGTGGRWESGRQGGFMNVHGRRCGRKRMLLFDLFCLTFEKKRAMYRNLYWKDLLSTAQRKMLIKHRNRTTKMPRVFSLATHAPKQLATLYPNTKALTSMLSLGLASSGLLGSTNAVCGTRAPFSES